MTVRDKYKVHARFEMAHQLAQKDRLTRSHFAGHEHETLLRLDSMNKRSQSLEIQRVLIKKSRIGRYAKRHFSKPKMTLKHGFVLLRAWEFGHLLTLLCGLVIAGFGQTSLFSVSPLWGNTIKNSFAVKTKLCCRPWCEENRI